MTTLKEKLKICGIKSNTHVIKLAESLVKLNEVVNNLDLISLSLKNIKLLKLYPEISKKYKTKEEIIASFYRRLIEKDTDCIDSVLGKCVQLSAVKKLFLETSLDLSKVPKIQKDLIDLVNNKYTDPITLQQQSLSNVVQLKESGEIMLMETFMDLVNRNTNEWRGKQNVGFFSPITNTMIGNPVLYNYDMEEFLPQRPGVLHIKTIPNVKNIPCTTRPMEIPKNYFMLTYNGFSFFLPDSAGGRQILFMMKDCFKKGNLFAYSNDGYIRHGRIHKKTRIEGTTYAYPDNTYLERVSGELMAVGSTLYTYRFSQDHVFSLFDDPYPDEKRFLIKFK